MSNKSLPYSLVVTDACLQPPVFVVSCARSGSSALCQSLGQHSHISMAEPEGPIIKNIGALAFDYALGRLASYYRSSVQLTEKEFRQTLQSLCYRSVFRANPETPDHESGHPFRRPSQPAGQGIRYWGAKAFPDKQAADGLLWLYPDARLIYLYRNGIDVVHSMSRFGMFRNLTFAERCQWWRGNAANYDYLRTFGRAVTVRFEDFLNDCASVFGRLFDFLDLPSHPGPGRFATTTLVHSLDRATMLTNPHEEISKRPSPWQAWTREQRDTFTDLCAETMAHLAYPMPE